MPRFADLEIDFDTETVSRDGAALAVSDRSFDLLRQLVQNAPGVVSHRDLLASVWPDQVVSPETLTQRVRLLRQTLGEAPGEAEYVVSVHGRGYRLGYPVNGGRRPPGPGRVKWRWVAVAIFSLALAYSVMTLLREEAPLAPPAPSESQDDESSDAPVPAVDDT